MEPKDSPTFESIIILLMKNNTIVGKDANHSGG